MSRTARVLTLLAALLLGLMYVTPVWSVRLVAPQYPEGIGMYIRLHTIEGMKEHDLDNINNLNHYIGMKVIEPDAIPELTYMPWIVAGLIAAGIAVAALGRRRLLTGWLVAFALLGVAGIYDFWRWGYDYGHNLDLEKAIIIIPDQSYQPPLIGTKQLLNFTATSLPSAGGIAAGLALALGAIAMFLSYRRRPSALRMATLALATSACAVNPAINMGRDSCLECRMIVADDRFGAVIVSSTGKMLPFDSVDCMLAYLHAHPDLEYTSAWVHDAAARGTFLTVDAAVFVRDGALRPPMGSVVAYGSADAASALGGASRAQLTWTALRSESAVAAH